MTRTSMIKNPICRVRPPTPPGADRLPYCSECVNCALRADNCGSIAVLFRKSPHVRVVMVCV